MTIIKRFKELQLQSNNSFYTYFRSPDGLAANRAFTLPLTAGSANQFLQTDGAGGLTWATPGGGGGSVSYMKRSGGTGAGSTNTNVTIYGTAVESVGSDITYQNSATLGDSFKVNTAGVYIVTVQQYQGVAAMAIKRGTVINNTFTLFEPPLEQVAAANHSAAYGCVTGQAYMSVNDIFWANATGTTADACWIEITGPY